MYDPDSDAGVAWNDPALDIQWPIDQPLLSKKDQVLPRLSDASRERLPR